jgi:hypothetical protein
MLTRNLIEAELSLAYVQAVAAVVTFSVDVPHNDMDSVDATVSGKGLIASDSIISSPRIELQLKASKNIHPNENGEIPFDLSIKNFNELRANTMVPRLLVLMSLPDDQSEWLIHNPDSLVLQKCCYYLNLKGLLDSYNGSNQRVYVPISNVLTPEALKNLMIKASKYEDL